jgi:hypothetical protein
MTRTDGVIGQYFFAIEVNFFDGKYMYFARGGSVKIF